MSDRNVVSQREEVRSWMTDVTQLHGWIIPKRLFSLGLILGVFYKQIKPGLNVKVGMHIAYILNKLLTMDV